MMLKIVMMTNLTLKLQKLSHPTEKKMTVPSLVTSPSHTGITCKNDLVFVSFDIETGGTYCVSCSVARKDY
jgi:hypothetical protein